MQVIDKTGKIYLSTAWYPLVDPTTGNVYQPGELVQVTENAWIKGQPTMVDQNPNVLPAAAVATLSSAGALPPMMKPAEKKAK